MRDPTIIFINYNILKWAAKQASKEGMPDQKLFPMMCLQEIKAAMSTCNMRRILNPRILSCANLGTSPSMMSLKLLSTVKILIHRGQKELGSNRIITRIMVIRRQRELEKRKNSSSDRSKPGLRI